MPGYPPRRIREMDHPLGMRRETLGSSGVVAEPSVLFSSGDGYVGDILELPQGCEGPFQGSRVKVGFLSRRHSRKRPHLALRGESPGFPRVAGTNLGFLLSYIGDLREPLMWPQVSPVSM